MFVINVFSPATLGAIAQTILPTREGLKWLIPKKKETLAADILSTIPQSMPKKTQVFSGIEQYLPEKDQKAARIAEQYRHETIDTPKTKTIPGFTIANLQSNIAKPKRS